MRAALILCFVQFIILSVATWEEERPENGVYQYQSSFKGPFGGSHISFWEVGGSALVTEQYVRLTPDEQSKRGWMWATRPSRQRDWESILVFSVGSDTRLGADGLALWHTKERSVPGPVYGSSKVWNGLLIAFDTFDNDGMRDNPVIFVVKNDGSFEFNTAQDGKDRALASCSVPFRQIVSNPESKTVRAKVRYHNKELSLFYDLSELNPSKVGWQHCFTVPVELPEQNTGYFFGLSAETGGLSDYHDVMSLMTYSIIQLNDNQNQAQFQQPNQQQQAQQQAQQQWTQQAQQVQQNQQNQQGQQWAQPNQQGQQQWAQPSQQGQQWAQPNQQAQQAQQWAQPNQQTHQQAQQWAQPNQQVQPNQQAQQQQAQQWVQQNQQAQPSQKRDESAAEAALVGRLSSMDSRQVQLSQNVDSKFSTLESKLGDLERTQLEALQRLEQQINARGSGDNSKVEQLRAELRGMTSSLSNLQTRLNDIQNQIEITSNKYNDLQQLYDAKSIEISGLVESSSSWGFRSFLFTLVCFTLILGYYFYKKREESKRRFY